MKLTPWFPADVKPVHEGDYEVKRYRSGGFGKMRPHRLTWDGEDWRYAHDFEKARKSDFASMKASDGDMWRGLAEEPKS